MLLHLMLIISFFNLNPCNYQEPKHVKVANEITEEVGKRVSQRYNIKIVGDYGALFGKINELGFRFQAKGPMTKESLREILIDCAEDLLKTVNEKEGIEDLLGSFPFNYDKISLAIFLTDKKGFDITYPMIGIAALDDGKLRYIIEEENNKIRTQETESYEDALKLVQGKLSENKSN